MFLGNHVALLHTAIDEGIRRSELTVSFNANMVEGVNGLGNSDLGTLVPTGELVHSVTH